MGNEFEPAFFCGCCQKGESPRASGAHVVVNLLFSLFSRTFRYIWAIDQDCSVKIAEALFLVLFFFGQNLA